MLVLLLLSTSLSTGSIIFYGAIVSPIIIVIITHTMVLYESRSNTNNTVDSTDPFDIAAAWFQLEQQHTFICFAHPKGSSTRQVLSTVVTTLQIHPPLSTTIRIPCFLLTILLLFSIRRFHQKFHLKILFEDSVWGFHFKDSIRFKSHYFATSSSPMLLQRGIDWVLLLFYLFECY